jgi:cytoskeleton protein RodZ
MTDATSSPLTIGQRLATARERTGVSATVAAERLHLDPKVVTALESDDFAALGAPVYVRGHLRRYAEFVGESPDELIALYTSGGAAQRSPDLTRVPAAGYPADPRRLLRPLLGAGLAAVLAVAVWWVLRGSAPDAPNATVTASAPAAAIATPSAAPSEAMPVSPAATEIPGATADGPSSAVATEPGAANTSPGAAAITPSAAPGPATGAAQSPVPVAPRAADAPASRETNLKLTLTTDSWIEVYDSRGRRLYYDIAPAGSVQQVAGRGPLRVVLGNAAGVGVEVNGRGAAVPANSIRGDEARFTVTSAGNLARSR